MDKTTRQEVRSAATRRVLLDATISCLVEHGYGGTTGPAVAAKAGLSRGAQLHHFGTRDQMVVAAVEHLAQKRLESVRSQLEAMIPERATSLSRRAIRLLADALSGPLYAATLELWVAARTDEALLAAVGPLEQRVGREAHRLTVAALGVDESRPGVRELVQATLDLVRGLGLASTITDDSARRRRILREWADVIDRELDRQEHEQ